MRKKAAFIKDGVLIDRSEIFHTSLNFAAVKGKKQPSSPSSPGPVNVRVKINRYRENDDVCLFRFETTWNLACT